MSTIRTKKIARSIEWPSKQHPIKSIAAYSLVELLVVIAVIAILVAIIFPVFNSAREKARQGTTIDNLARIQNGLERYQLDHRGQYPPVLFAYSDGTHSMANIKSAGSAYLVGLYPLYVNDPAVFTDPDNKINDVSSTLTVSPNVNTLTDGALTVSQTHLFFQGDAYDVSPEIQGPNQTGATYVPRYQSAWTSSPMPAGFTVPSGDYAATEFSRQMDQPNAPGDTYVTMTTYHVQKANMVIVLFKNGSTKVFDSSKLLSAGCGDTADISASNGIANAKFWWIKPTGNCP